MKASTPEARVRATCADKRRGERHCYEERPLAQRPLLTPSTIGSEVTLTNQPGGGDRGVLPPPAGYVAASAAWTPLAASRISTSLSGAKRLVSSTSVKRRSSSISTR